MKTLVQYLEELEGSATPLNTMGMGNVGGESGMEPLISKITDKKTKKRVKKEKLS